MREDGSPERRAECKTDPVRTVLTRKHPPLQMLVSLRPGRCGVEAGLICQRACGKRSRRS